MASREPDASVRPSATKATAVTGPRGPANVCRTRPADDRRGSGWVKGGCRALADREVSLSLTLAYRLLLFAARYPGRKRVARVRRLGKTVSREVMMRVIPIEDESTRDEILQRTVDDKLSSRAVIELVQEVTGYDREWQGRQPEPEEASTHLHRALIPPVGQVTGDHHLAGRLDFSFGHP